MPLAHSPTHRHAASALIFWPLRYPLTLLRPLQEENNIISFNIAAHVHILTMPGTFHPAGGETIVRKLPVNALPRPPPFRIALKFYQRVAMSILCTPATGDPRDP